MNRKEIMMRVLTATPETIGRAAEVLDGRPTETTTGDRRLLTLTAAAHELNLSRMSIHRMCKDGRLPTITTRAGRRRIASAAITEFLKGAPNEDRNNHPLYPLPFQEQARCPLPEAAKMQGL